MYIIYKLKKYSAVAEINLKSFFLEVFEFTSYILNFLLSISFFFHDWKK